MTRICKIIFNLIFVIIIALLLIYFILRVTDKIEIYKVKTGSMEEKIHVGDYILIYQKNSYDVGEVVTYTSNDGFITHRIIKKEKGKVITKGDANNVEDKEIIESAIVGKVIISGGILNYLINYKYVIVCILLSMYFFSCYIGNTKQQKKEKGLNFNTDEDKEEEKIKIEKNNEVQDKTETKKDKLKKK